MKHSTCGLNRQLPALFIAVITSFFMVGSVAAENKNATPEASDASRSLSSVGGRPNIVIVLIDDAGFAATDVFGGPVATPTLSQLAKQGLRYNNFNTTSICSPTRAALLTGRNHHRVGFGYVEEVTKDAPGYNGVWKESTASIAEVLRKSGYSTAAFGKWHNTPYVELTPVGPFDRWPTGLGFEYFYGFMQGADSQWEPQLYRGTVAVDAPKSLADGYHFTSDITDGAIAWLQTHESLAPQKPYFIYYAPGATHAPHHVPPKWIEAYHGKFDMGWDKLREEIFARQKKLGVIPANAKLTPRPAEMPAWDSLSPDEKKVVARQMEVYAGFYAHTDYEIGRLLKEVQKGEGGKNTMIFYIAGDNGASAEAGDLGSDYAFANIGRSPPAQEQLKNLDGLGSVKYDNQYANAWAWAMDTPFQWVKQVASHFGGTRNPLVVAWPQGIKDKGGLRTQFTHVNDIVPTIYEAIGITPPSEVNGVKQQDMDGTSFLYSFDSSLEPSRHHVQYFEVRGNRAIYKDGWMASAKHVLPWSWTDNNDYSSDRWELYHLDNDFSQAEDLAAKFPEKLEELKKVFDREAAKNDVLPMGLATGRSFMEANDSRNRWVFYPTLPRISVLAAPRLPASHTISADLKLPPANAEGVILSYGSRFGGFVFYVKDGYLVYENNAGGKHIDKIISDSRLPAGNVQVTYEFSAKDMNKNNGWPAIGGVGKLFVNEKLVGQGDIPFFSPAQSHGSFGIGRGYASPVSPAYEVPFKFNGVIDRVVITLDQTKSLNANGTLGKRAEPVSRPDSAEL